MVASEEIRKIHNKWFLIEPVYFMVLSMFRPTENETITKFAIANKHLYYNPYYVERLTKKQLEECLKVECLRILLKHPFNRFNKRANPLIAYIASNAVIGDHLKLAETNILKGTSGVDAITLKLCGRRVFSITSKKPYEEMYRTIKSFIEKECGEDATEDDIVALMDKFADDIASNNEDRISATKYWCDDMVASTTVGRIVERLRGGSLRGIGSIPAGLIEQITADEPPEYDYREPLRRFRHSIISSGKILTRMRPNRRYGYDQMGSLKEYQSNMLIVCDASGSMTTPILNKFLGFANNFFKYGLASVDIVTFDTKIYDDSLKTLKRHTYKFDCHGRGGTDIDDILDYVNNRSKKHYDGVLVFTDGGYSFNVDKWINAAKDTKYIFCITEECMYDKHEKALSNYASSNLKITYIDINE